MLMQICQKYDYEEEFIKTVNSNPKFKKKLLGGWFMDMCYAGSVWNHPSKYSANREEYRSLVTRYNRVCTEFRNNYWEYRNKGVL